MKKIGIVDYFIDEWHSNHYLGLFKRACEELKLDYQITYGWAELDRFEDRLSTDEWCRKNGIVKCDTIKELCEKSDNILILAPANPEKHLGYAKEVLKHKKNTYIDKTFTTDLETAKKIYEIAESYGTKFFSTSALRYADELKQFEGKVKSVNVTGNGRSWQEYIIHQIEIAVSLMKSKADSLYVFDRTDQMNVIINFGERTCSLSYSSSDLPFTADIACDGCQKPIYKRLESDYFYNLIKSIITFFESGELLFEPFETLTAIAVRDAVLEGKSLPMGSKISVKK